MIHIYRSFILIFISFLLTTCQSQQQSNLNLDFETLEGKLPKNWSIKGDNDLEVYLDSIKKRSGKYSAVIHNPTSETGNKAMAIKLPENYAGKKIKLTGFIKTENITDGFAGLWMRIDPGLGFDNMANRGIKGTTDWQFYEIELALKPEKTEQIYIGALLVGKGKMWVDQLKVIVDGNDISSHKVKLFEKVILPADQDKEFDKGSSLIQDSIQQVSIENLELLGRIWGFLKYHHPAIAKGDYNWDYELFRVLKNFQQIKNKKERDELLIKWIQKLGKLETCTTCKETSKDAILKPDLMWMDQFNMNATLIALLKDIYKNRSQGSHYYIDLIPNVNNPEFKNEKFYETMPYPDAGFRLLTVYKYWNMINYYFPYKHLTDKNWNDVLAEYIPEFLKAQDELAFELAALKLIGEVNDTHANLWGGGDKIDSYRGTNYPPYQVEFIENSLVVTKVLTLDSITNQELKVGDVITHIQGKTVKSIVDSVSEYYPASNMSARMRDIARKILLSREKELQIRYQTKNTSKQTSIPLNTRQFPYKDQTIKEKSYKILEGNIGYLTLETISTFDIEPIKKEFKNCKAIIIDIRNYPATFVPFILGKFFTKMPTEFVKFARANKNNPGEFNMQNGKTIPFEGDYFKGKLMVLVNEQSQSQSEYTAMAFRAIPGAKIIGSQTAGADGNVSTIQLPGGLRTMISGTGVYYPDGKETQRIGIVPDVLIKPTIEGIRNGKDEVLEKAIQLINEN